MSADNWKAMEEKEDRMERLAFICAGIIFTGAAAVAVPFSIAHWEAVRPLFATFFFILAAAVIAIQAFRALFEDYTPLPEKGWVGAVMSVQPVEVERIMTSALTLAEKTEWLDRYGVLYQIFGSNIEITYQPAGKRGYYEVEVWAENGEVVERRVPEEKEERQEPAKATEPSRREQVNKELEKKGLRPRHGYRPAQPISPGAKFDSIN